MECRQCSACLRGGVYVVEQSMAQQFNLLMAELMTAIESYLV